VGDVFQSVRITGLPLTPPIHCRGTVAHLGATEPYAGLLLEETSEGDQKNIERLLIPRLPATFGEVFPARRRKPDFADKLGAPTPTQIKAKAPELVGGALASAADRPDPSGRPAGALLRLRKSGKKILFLSGHPGTPALVDGFRQDGFRQVSEARSYQEAKTLAEQIRFDLVILDLRVGAHWAQDIMESLASHDLLLDTPVILVVEHRNEGVNTVARALGAVHVHDRRQSCAELLPVACRLLLD
jgi:CheY-like chemotaxis protein